MIFAREKISMRHETKTWCNIIFGEACYFINLVRATKLPIPHGLINL